MEEIIIDPDTREKMEDIISLGPVFFRDEVRQKVTERLKLILKEEGRSLVTEKELVAAFFDVIPPKNHGPLKADMKSIGIDYTQYGYSE